MENQLAVEVLEKKRRQLLIQKEQFLEKINAEISSMEASIESLSGKKVWEIENTVLYDDENLDYIRGSIEEI